MEKGGQRNRKKGKEEDVMEKYIKRKRKRESKMMIR